MRAAAGRAEATLGTLARMGQRGDMPKTLVIGCPKVADFG